MELKPGVNNYCIVRCPGLHNTLSGYNECFPWIKKTLFIPDSGILGFVLCSYFNIYATAEDASDVYSDFAEEVGMLINDINECRDDDSGYQHYLEPQYRDVYFNLNDPVQSEKHISYINKMIESISPVFENVGISEADVHSLEGDYIVIRPYS